MRISELEARTGVSAATIKYYAREGLLPTGERVGYNQTDYDESHVERLRLIRAMTSVGGLPLATTAEVLRAVDDPEMPLFDAMGVAHTSLPAPAITPGADSLDRVRRLIADRGWRIHPEAPAIATAAGVLDAFAGVGRADLGATLDRYAEPAERVADADLATIDPGMSRERVAETVVVGTVLGDVLFAALRRLAQEDRTARMLSAGHSTATARMLSASHSTATDRMPSAGHPATTALEEDR